MVKRSNDFKSTVKNVLQNSMLTGIPQIASTRNTYKKLSRVFVFVFCVGGFIYQSKSFLDLYWEYRTVVDVQVQNEEYVDLPAITICNFNGIQNTRLCKALPKYCKPLKDIDYASRFNLCNCTDRYCDRNGKAIVQDLFPAWDHYDEACRLAVEDQQDFIQPAKQMFKSCVMRFAKRGVKDSSCNVSEAISIRARPQQHGGNVCYTLNSLINDPDKPIEKVLATTRIIMRLNANISEYVSVSEPVEPTGVMDISIHNPYTVANPYSYGYKLRNTRDFILRLKKTIRKSLPAPYETNCTDYIALWKQRGGRGPINQQECAQECMANVSLSKFGCVSAFVDWPNNYAICQYDTISLYSQAAICAEKNCRQACYEETYQIDLQTVEDIPYPRTECTTRNTRNRKFREEIWISIELNRMETTIYSTRPQFEDIETFSYLGGYVGMWLGISLLAVFDFIEAIYTIAKYPLQQKRQRQKDKMIRVTPTPPRH